MAVSDGKRNAPYSGGMRALDGLTVFASSSAGVDAVLSRRCMPLRGALLSICRELDSWDGEWHIDVISSPTTIWTDLQGRWTPDERGKRELKPLGPERSLLGRIGRLDLLREAGA